MKTEVIVSKYEIESLRKFFAAKNNELEKASDYSLSGTIKWLKTQMIRQVAKEYRIQQQPLKEKTPGGSSRTWTSTKKKDKSARLWFGVRNLSLARLKPKQNKYGVRAGVGGSIFEKSAFLMPISKKNGGSAVVPFQVMRRNGTWRLASRGLATKGRYCGTGAQREMLSKVMFEYNDKAIEVTPKLTKEAQKKLTDALRSKLQWQTDRK